MNADGCRWEKNLRREEASPDVRSMRFAGRGGNGRMGMDRIGNERVARGEGRKEGVEKMVLKLWFLRDSGLSGGGTAKAADTPGSAADSLPR